MDVLKIHAFNPQLRLISQAAARIRSGGLIVYPTDSSYAFGCHMGNKTALERVRRLRQIDSSHDFTLLCRDLSEIATYALVSNSAYRLLKSLTPGPYTFILKAGREVPRRLQNPRRRTIGIRVTDNPIARALIESLGEPLMTSTLILPGDDMPLTDAEDIKIRIGNQVDLIIDGGNCGYEMTTVVDLLGEAPVIVRQGKGDTSMFTQ